MGIDAVVLVRFILTGVALLLAFLAIAAWNRRREAAEAKTFAILVALMAVYAFGYAGEVAQNSVAAAARWLDVEYLALPWAGALWVLAACQHNRQRVQSWPLFIIPTITFIGHYTNFHHLFYRSPMTMAYRNPFWVLQFDRGWISTLDNAYLLVCFLAGSWVYISGLRQIAPLFRRQALVMVFSSFVPFLGYFVYLAGLSPWGLDITPLSLSVTCGLLYYGIFHCGVLNLTPLARTLIFNTMRDAVMVLDNSNRLLDFNPAASALFPVLQGRNTGTLMDSMLSSTPGLIEALHSPEETLEFEMRDEHGLRYFEIHKWLLDLKGEAKAGAPVGRAVILADVTAQVRLREELRRSSETDALTGVANRRRFHQALEIECLRFVRGHAPLCVMMIDLDNFKEINDRYGHPAGDEVLKAVTERLLNCMRKTDLLARYGGEEFAVLLPETRSEGASVIAERIRTAVEMSPVFVDQAEIPLTASIGVAGHTTDAEVDPQILLKKADIALYRAKTAGRNRVEVH